MKDPSDITRISSQVDIAASRAAENIAGYAACTDLYLNQSLVLRVLMSTLWEQRLLQFVNDFAERRMEIREALLSCSARGTSMIQQEMQIMNKRWSPRLMFCPVSSDLSFRMQDLTGLFRRLKPTIEAEVQSEVEKKGGREELLNRGNNQALREINEIANQLGGEGGGSKARRGPELTLERLTELMRGFDERIERHIKILEGKVNLQDPASEISRGKGAGKKEFMHERIADPVSTMSIPMFEFNNCTMLIA